MRKGGGKKRDGRCGEKGESGKNVKLIKGKKKWYEFFMIYCGSFG